MSLLFILLYAKNTSKSPSLVSCCEAWKHAQAVGPSVRCDQILTCIWLISRAQCPGRELKISALKAVCTCPRRWLRGSGVPLFPEYRGFGEQLNKNRNERFWLARVKVWISLRPQRLFLSCYTKKLGSIQASRYGCWWFHLKGTFVGKRRGTRHLSLQNRENLEFVFFLFCCAFIVSNLSQNRSAPGCTPLPV